MEAEYKSVLSHVTANPGPSLKQTLISLGIKLTTFYDARPMVEYFLLDPVSFDTDASAAVTKAEFVKTCKEKLASVELRDTAADMRKNGEFFANF